MRTLVLMITAGCLADGKAHGQTPADPAKPTAGVRVEHDVLIAGPKADVFFDRQVVSLSGANTVEFVSTEANFSGKVVKGAPYSAEAVTETSQTLSDGNRISKKSVAATYRDSEGRTRRDMTMPAVGPWATQGDAPSFVVIHDPAAGVSYHLDSKTKTARKLPNFSTAFDFPPIAEASVSRSRVLPDMKGPVTSARQGPKTESLGKQVIDGIQAEGSRSTVTIPAGEIGNEQPIHIVSERWYSPELQLVLLSKHTDPRVGETVHRLTNIRRSDPHPSLFQIPSDYKLVEDEGPVRMLRKMEKRDEE